MLRRWTYFQPLSANSLRPATEKCFKFVLSIISTPAGNANLEKQEKKQVLPFPCAPDHWCAPEIWSEKHFVASCLDFISWKKSCLAPFEARLRVCAFVRRRALYLSWSKYHQKCLDSWRPSVFAVIFRGPPEEVHTTIHDLNQSTSCRRHIHEWSRIFVVNLDGILNHAFRLDPYFFAY